MAVIVEDGTGLANADAYISVADAAVYLAGRGNADAWDAIDDKDAALRLGADYMTQMYRKRWLGYRATNVQALDWPRGNVPKADAPSGYGYAEALYASTEVPNEVKWANALLALKTPSLTLLPDTTQKVIEESVGPITVKYDQAAPAERRFTAVDSLLALLLIPESGMVKLGRA